MLQQDQFRHNGIKCSQQPQLLSGMIVVLKLTRSQQEEDEVLNLIRLNPSARAAQCQTVPWNLSAALLAPSHDVRSYESRHMMKAFRGPYQYEQA